MEPPRENSMSVLRVEKVTQCCVTDSPYIHFVFMPHSVIVCGAEDTQPAVMYHT